MVLARVYLKGKHSINLHLKSSLIKSIASLITLYLKEATKTSIEILKIGSG